MKKIITITAALLLLVTFSTVQAQDSFNRSYKWRKVKEYNSTTKEYEIQDEYEENSIIFFNINGTKNAKILMDGLAPVIFYMMTLDDEQPNEDYTYFTVYSENGTKVYGTAANGWITFYLGDVAVTYSDYPSQQQEE